MSDETVIPPALTAEEWAQPVEYGQRLWTFENDVQVAIGEGDVKVNWDGAVYQSAMQPLGNKAVAVMALINHALPDDSPYKITREMVGWLEDAAREYEGGLVGRGDLQLRRLCAALNALLPPV